MQKGNQHSVGTKPRSLIDHLKSLIFQSCNFLRNIFDFQRDVMNTLAAFFEKFRNRRIRADWRGKLDHRAFQIERSDADFLVCNFLMMNARIPKELREKLLRLSEIAHGNAEMGNFHHRDNSKKEENV